MLCLIPIVGGLLIMMGQHDRSEALFYCIGRMRPDAARPAKKPADELPLKVCRHQFAYRRLQVDSGISSDLGPKLGPTRRPYSTQNGG